MRSANVVLKEIKEETSLVRTFRFDRSFDPHPGQYMMLWVRGVDEIPMSFSGSDEMTVQRVGEATEALFSCREGDSLGVRGPYGNGFSLVGNSVLLVGGGVGVAPLAYLGETATTRGLKVTTLMGFRSREEIIFSSRFQELGEVITTTDDGSLGIKGRISRGLDELDLEGYDQIYLCGPELMMADVITRAKGHAHKIQACINRYFKCGLGICGSCCLDPEGIRVCVEGPVIMADRLLDGEFGRYRRGPSGGRGPCRG